MKIAITIPSFAVHGGIRIIMEWANRLTQWHDVSLYSLAGGSPDWFKLNSKVKLIQEYNGNDYDLLLITSPHSIHLTDRSDCPEKVYLFMQMLEHMFKPNDKAWFNLCKKFYMAPYPMFVLAKWNEEELRKMGRTAPVIYIGNGVNTDDFVVEMDLIKDNKTVLVEGWEAMNPTKDVDNIAPKVAKRLKDEGYYVIGFSQVPLRTMPDALNEYHYKPDTTKLNELYRRASVLLKATKYDAQSCSPMEAMTKGTVTARAIIKGDDDLMINYNASIVNYNENELYEAAKNLLSTDEKMWAHYSDLSINCIKYIQKYSWDYWMEKINAELSKPTSKQAVECVIVSIIYEEPEWQETKRCIEATGLPVVYVDRKGTGSLAKAINEGFKQACRFYEFSYVWFVTNITFDPIVPKVLIEDLDMNGRAAVHPSLDSDHIFAQKFYAKEVKDVPFVEFTAPMVIANVFKKYPLNEAMPYWGHDIDWCARLRADGHTVAVDYDISINHVYIRNSKTHQATLNRRQLRAKSDNATRKELERIYGADWRKKIFPSTEAEIKNYMTLKSEPCEA